MECKTTETTTTRPTQVSTVESLIPLGLFWKLSLAHSLSHSQPTPHSSSWKAPKGDRDNSNPQWPRGLAW